MIYKYDPCGSGHLFVVKVAAWGVVRELEVAYMQ
jgi:hypothetical protein